MINKPTKADTTNMLEALKVAKKFMLEFDTPATLERDQAGNWMIMYLFRPQPYPEFIDGFQIIPVQS